MTRIVVTGAGSLVGFSLLECLEGRRDGLELVGLTSEGSESEALRYDRCIVVPPSDDPAFRTTLEQHLDELRPDLVIPGRDPDIAHLADIRDRRPELGPVLMCGNHNTALITLDKARTWAFADERGLPWVDTLVGGSRPDRVTEFAVVHPMPWLAKPARGSASQGVFLLTDPTHVTPWLERPDYVIQPMLGGSRQFPHPPDPSWGTPWFTDIGEPHLRSVQVLVGPDGTVGPAFCSDHVLSGGLTQQSRVASDPTAVDLGRQWAAELAAAGWRGSLNIQTKVHDGTAVPFEINGRPSGATHGRLLLGFDEVGWTIRAWTGVRLPAVSTEAARVAHYRPKVWPGPAA